MRNINRIDPLLAKLGEVWKQYPDLRFGQFIINLFHDLGTDPWIVEDDDWLEYFTEVAVCWAQKGVVK